MAVLPKTLWTVPFAALLLVAGCEEGANPFQGDVSRASDETLDIPEGPAVIERDVEAPEIFSADETGLWDGRPSLGGIWVAHPDVGDPERVVIRNTENGQEVIGALFRRERDNPGPRIQVSSEAAEELKMLAGKPAELSVVVLRRKEQEVERQEPAPETVDVAAAMPEPGEVTAAQIEVAPIEPATSAAEIAEAASQEAPAIQVAEAAPAPAAEAPAAPRRTAAEIAAEALRVFKRPAPAPAEEATTQLAAAAPAATRPALPQTSAARISDALSGQKNVIEEPKAEPASTLAKPFIQIGIFSRIENAEFAGLELRDNGVVPEIRETQSNEKRFWRVLVGPAQNRTEQSALLEKVKALGYSDAYAVSN